MTTDATSAPTAPLRAGCQGEPPLTARLEPWMTELLADREACHGLVEHYGSPLNVHDFGPLTRNAAELTAAADEAGVGLRVFVARKANKTLGMVEAARRAGLGVDVGSYRELEQVLAAGVPADDVVVTAAVKPRPTVRLALDARATLVLDNLDEAAAVDAEAAGTERAAPRHPVALRLAPRPSDRIPPTRFGESVATWLTWARGRDADHDRLRVDGVHFHLHGYDAGARAEALGEALELVDELRALGHRPGFIDIGGGIPMSYLDDAEQWNRFWREHDARPDALLWRGKPLEQVYPYHQELVRGPWLRELLALPVGPGISAAEALRGRGLELRCEPGRALLDGCGLTLARVVQRTTTSDDVPLLGLEMNRTQCRSTSDDFLVDPVLVRAEGAARESFTGFLVGAYCIEAELILRRRLRFPDGAGAGDLVAFPNTAGYLMHILESASHQIPLASNVVAGGGQYERDGIDAVSPIRPM